VLACGGGQAALVRRATVYCCHRQCPAPLESLQIDANPRASRVGGARLLLSAAIIPPAVVFLVPLLSAAAVVAAVGLLLWMLRLLGLLCRQGAADSAAVAGGG
jgi:nitrate reductase NapE component